MNIENVKVGQKVRIKPQYVAYCNQYHGLAPKKVRNGDTFKVLEVIKCREIDSCSVKCGKRVKLTSIDLAADCYFYECLDENGQRIQKFDKYGSRIASYELAFDLVEDIFDLKLNEEDFKL